ncbi:MAG: tetratricopeptide repeat protein [Anaerolineales bacterium]|nr:tetratricopeptide repeat protein [Anaerolineales bacterium]
MDTLAPPQFASPFAQTVAANLGYWQQRKNYPLPLAPAERLADLRNLSFALRFGMECEPTRSQSLDLMGTWFETFEIHGPWKEWIHLMERAIQLCQEEAPAQACKLLNRLGFLYRLDRQLPTALEIHHRTLHLTEQMALEFEQVYAHFFLSDDYYAVKNYEQAILQGQLAVAGFERLGAFGPELAGAYNTLGLVAMEQGFFEQAETHYTQALALFKTNQRREKQLHVMNNLAVVLAKMGQYDTALNWIEKALHLLAETPNPILATHLRLMQGTIYFETRAFAQAEATFLAIDTLFLQQTGLVWHLGAVSTDLGNVALETARYPEAEAYLSEAVRHFRQVDDGLNLANSLGDLARAVASQGRGLEAKAFYDEALNLLQNYTQNEWARRLSAKFSAARQRLDELKK